MINKKALIITLIISCILYTYIGISLAKAPKGITAPWCGSYTPIINLPVSWEGGR
jgi:hypothetical protein